MEKPLPDVPHPSAGAGNLKSPRGPGTKRATQISTNTTTLTIDARDHLHQFILAALEGEGEEKEGTSAGSSESERLEWAVGLETALGALGERISLGGWLPGLRRARTRRRQEKELARAKERASSKRMESTDTVMPSRKEEGTLKSKGTLHHPHFDPKDELGYLSAGLKDGEKAEEGRRASVQLLRDLASRPGVATPKPTAKHLLLTVTSYGAPVPPPPEDMGYEFVRSNLECVFTAGVFSLPQDETLAQSDAHGAVLYGLETWDLGPSAGSDTLQIVGGTFSFRGVLSEAQHAALTKVLRLSIYVYLSNILEQSLLSNSHVPLRFPKPSMSPTTQAGPMSRALSTSHVGSKHHKRDSQSGLWAFFSRKKETLLQRSSTPGVVRRGSLELPLTRKLTRDRSPVPRISDDSTSPRPRRFEFLGDYRPAFMLSSKGPEPEERPFSAALAQIQKYKGLLSASPHVTYSPPSLLVHLAQRESSDPGRRLCGDEKAALTSLLGWEGKNGTGMSDTAGFVRQQSFSALYSEYVPQPATSRPATPGSSQSSFGSLQPSQPSDKSVLCGRRRRWVTFRFYSREGGTDECLGETILRLCARADERCDEPGCSFRRGEHELRFVHGTVRITVKVRPASSLDAEKEGEGDLPQMSVSCKVCAKQSPKDQMLDGTYLFSFAKFLELLVYSPTLSHVTPPLCAHTTLPPRPRPASDSPLPHTRMNLVRDFTFNKWTVSFVLSPVGDIYEVRVPRFQILRSKGQDKPEDTERLPPVASVSIETDRRALRREIMQFWQVLSEHMDQLEGNFMNEHPVSFHKSLPRLPSADDAYETFDDDDLLTPKGEPSKLPPHPPNTPRTPGTISSNNSYPFPNKSASRDLSSTESQSSSSLSTSGLSQNSDQGSLHRLSNLRHTFQRTEQGLYTELSRTPVSNLNDVRRSFFSAAHGATRRLSAWEAKHAAGSPTASEAVAQCEPEWWKNGCHAVPGGNVIVREDDWGSIIAFTLSSMDYHKELGNMSTNRSTVVPAVPPPTPAVSRPSFFVKTASAKWFGPTIPMPDPDQEGVVWHEPETYSAVISRKEHPRDPTSLLKLGIPDVLRQKPIADPAYPNASKLGSLGSASGKGIPVVPPPSAWAKPDVQISTQAAGGLLSAAAVDRVDKVLHDLEAAEPAKAIRRVPSDTHLSSGFVETNIRRGKASSIMSTNSDVTTVGEHSTSTHSITPPIPPPKDESESHQGSSSSTRDPPIEHSQSPLPALAAAAFTNTLSSAFRYMMRTGEAPPTPAKHHHGLLSATCPAIDDKPHIKYDWTIGKRLKFSCTVYYAKQFDALRRRCGTEDMFLQSLSRSENWIAEGGKSKSNFWKTADNQFIIKTLVNAWNVADLHVLIELGPSYFRYMDATASKPTVLAKLLGFYTVEIKNLETGTIQAKADLLVMENLFYKQNIVKTFDLKGIQGRKVKAASSSSGSKTLFDGDWIEGQQRALTLVQPHSKVVLQEAIKADSEFLAKSNIMDYSLLVGIDEDNKQIACGLVDTIGSYTFAKTLEYKAKQGLNSGKEVTVVPPNEYQERFINAMDDYFVACPDKWSRPLDDTKIPGDYQQLPSVL